MAFRACEGTAAEKREAAVQDTQAGMREISVDVLQNILLAMKAEVQTDEPAALVAKIVQTATQAPCSDSYFSMIVYTNRASEDTDVSLSDSDEDANEDEDNAVAIPEEHAAAGGDDDGDNGAKESALLPPPPPAAAAAAAAKQRKDKQFASPLSCSWAVYESKEQLDTLLAFLNPAGMREGVLRKEILKIQDRFEQALAEAAERESGTGSSSSESSSRRSKRTKKFNRGKTGLQARILSYHMVRKYQSCMVLSVSVAGGERDRSRHYLTVHLDHQAQPGRVGPTEGHFAPL